NAVNATIADAQGVGTILNDDGSGGVTFTPATNFAVGTSPASAAVAVFKWDGGSKSVAESLATADNTATAGSDYVATSGTLTFNPGDTSKTIAVVVNGDTVVERNETFFVNLTNAVNATIADAQGVGTILNDDGSGGVTFTPATNFAVGTSPVSVAVGDFNGD